MTSINVDHASINVDHAPNSYISEENIGPVAEKNAGRVAVDRTVAKVAGAIFLALGVSVAVVAMPVLIVPLTFFLLGGLIALVARNCLFNRMSLEDKTAQVRIKDNSEVLYKSLIEGNSVLEAALGDSTIGVRDTIWKINHKDNAVQEYLTQESKVVDSDGNPLECPDLFMRDLERSSGFKIQNEVSFSNAWDVKKRPVNMGKAVKKLEEVCSEESNNGNGKLIAERLMRCMTQTNTNDLSMIASILYVSHVEGDGFKLSAKAVEGDNLTNVGGKGASWSVLIQSGEVLLTVKQNLIFRHLEQPEIVQGLVQCKREIRIPLKELEDPRIEGSSDFPLKEFLPSLTVTDTWSKLFSRPLFFEMYSIFSDL